MRTNESCSKNVEPFPSVSGKPEGLKNCTTINQTYESLSIVCQAGFTGMGEENQEQSFVLEVKTKTTGFFGDKKTRNEIEQSEFMAVPSSIHFGSLFSMQFFRPAVAGGLGRDGQARQAISAGPSPPLSCLSISR